MRSTLFVGLMIFLGINFFCREKSPSCSTEVSGMKCIPAGEFMRGSNNHREDEKPAEKIFVAEFFMDTYEVTNKDFNECLAAGKCADCLKNNTCTQVKPGYGKPYMRDRQPIVGISWYTAKEYCAFRGKRLPTEAEWEKAARGPDGNLFPWGNEPATCARAIIEEQKDGVRIKGCQPRRTAIEWHMTTDDVGTRPPGAYGLYDMAGNSWEWTQDWYAKSYTACGDACRGKNPKGPCAGRDECPGHRQRVVKGGSWWWPGDYARGSARRAHIPENFPEYHHFGFRCAKDSPVAGP